MLPAITDFFQTALTDNLKKFLQPTYLIVAAIFTLLNLLIIFPDLVTHNILFAVRLLSLNAVQQSILIVVVIFVLAYLLLSASGTIFSLMTGESWDKSLIGRLLRSLQMHEWKHLNNQMNVDIVKQVQSKKTQSQEATETYKEELKLQANIARLERMTRYPEHEEHVGPTALGNVINAVSDNIWHRYSMDMVALWPHMEIALAKTDNEELRSRVGNEKIALDFLVNLAFVLVLFAIEQLLVQICILDHDALALLEPLVISVLAFIVYRAAVVKARSWGTVVQMVFDMHRDDLRKLLGLREFSNSEDERVVWNRVSGWLLWRDKADDVFISQPSVTITASENVKAEIFTSMINVARPELKIVRQSEAVTGVRVFTCIHHVLLITYTAASSDNTASATNTTNPGGPGGINDTGDIYLLVSDPRVDQLVYPPDAQSTLTASVEVMHTTEPGKVDALLWCLKGLKPGTATTLTYDIPFLYYTVTVNDGKLGLREELETSAGKIKHSVTISNGETDDTADLTLSVFDNYSTLPATIEGYLLANFNGPDEVQKSPVAQVSPGSKRFSWDIMSIKGANATMLTYELSPGLMVSE